MILGQTHFQICRFRVLNVVYPQYMYRTGTASNGNDARRDFVSRLRFSSCCWAYENYTRGIYDTTKPSAAFGGTFSPS